VFTLGELSRDIVSAFSKRDIPNFICVSWEKLCGPNMMNQSLLQPLGELSYPIIIKQSSLIVGTRIAKFLSFLVDNRFASDFGSFHLIGHSMGAHVMGIAGYLIRKDRGRRVGHITGLEPAGIQPKNLDRNGQWTWRNTNSKSFCGS